MKKAIITGNLTKDVELRMVGKDDAKKYVATLSIACNEIAADKETTYFEVEVWGKQAEACAKHLSKGAGVSLIAEIATNNYEKDGKKHYGYKFIGEEVQFLSTGRKAAQENE